MRSKIISIASVMLLLLCLCGCMASSPSIPADKAFALSASALSGSEHYQFSGEFSVQGPGGWVSSKAAYEGEVTSHGNLKLQWKNTGVNAYGNVHTESSKTTDITAYRPLQILALLNKPSAEITYSETPIPYKPVQFHIKLDHAAAKKRVAEDLRAELALLRTENSLLKRNPVEARKILDDADKRLEAALATLEVSTECNWTANPKNWFPRQLKEETVLKYIWENKPYEEQRISITDFLPNAQGDTIKSK